jgi:hypothetical protein
MIFLGAVASDGCDMPRISSVKKPLRFNEPAACPPVFIQSNALSSTAEGGEDRFFCNRNCRRRRFTVKTPHAERRQF